MMQTGVPANTDVSGVRMPICRALCIMPTVLQSFKKTIKELHHTRSQGATRLCPGCRLYVLLFRSVPRAEWCRHRVAQLLCTLLDTNSATSDRPKGEPSMCRLPTFERGDPGDAESFRRGFCGTRASAETTCNKLADHPDDLSTHCQLQQRCNDL